MSIMIDANTKINVQALNEDIKLFPQVHPVAPDMKVTHEGVSRLVMLDRYAFKDTEKKTLKQGDFVVLTVKPDPKFPARGYGFITSIDWENQQAEIKVAEDFINILEGKEAETGIVKRDFDVIDKPLEIFYEQIAMRNATGLSEVEKTAENKQKYFKLFGPDSREGISDHRKQVMEIMSRGGGVGTTGSTLRPRNTLARGVNGKSAGSVSWLDDIAKLTHLVEQGGSRRGAQMIMLSD